MQSRSYLQSTVKHGGIYAIGTFLSRLAGFIMLPVYTRVLTVDEYGVLEILGLTTDVLSMLAGLGIGMAVTRFYYHFSEQHDRNAVVSTAWILMCTLFVVVAVVCLVLAEDISSALLGEGQSPNLVRLAVGGLVLNVLSDLPLIYFRTRQQSLAVVAGSVARLVIALALNILLVVYFKLGVLGVLYSTIVASFIVGSVMTTQMIRETGVRFVPSTARLLVAFGAPLLLAQLSSFVLHFSDRYFLRVYASLAVVGIYSVSYKFAMLLSMLISAPFKNIWIPKALEIAQKEGDLAIPILARILSYFNILLVSAGLVIALFAKDVVYLVAGSAFLDAAAPVPLLVLAMIFFGYRSMSQIGPMIAKDTRSIAVSTSIAAVAITALNFLLIPLYGMMGAAAATLGGFALEFFVMRFFALRLYKLPIPLGQLLLPVAVAAAVWALAELISDSSGIVASVVVRVLACVVYAATLRALGVLSAADVERLRMAFRTPQSFIRGLRGG